MLGVFLAFGVDTLVIVGVLWYVGQLSGATAGGVSAAILILFSLWVLGRWLRLHGMDLSSRDDTESTDSHEQRDPFAKLKQRYAEGELTDEEFEQRLDKILDADRQVELVTETATQRGEQSHESK